MGRRAWRACLVLSSWVLGSCSASMPPTWTPDQTPVCTQGVTPKVLWTAGGVVMAISGTAGPLLHALWMCGPECSDTDDKTIIVTWSAVSVVGAAIAGAGFVIDGGQTMRCVGSEKAHEAYRDAEPVEELADTSCPAVRRTYCDSSNLALKGRYYAELERRGCLPETAGQLVCKTSCESLRPYLDVATDLEVQRPLYAEHQRQGCRATCEDLWWLHEHSADPAAKQRHGERWRAKCAAPARRRL